MKRYIITRKQKSVLKVESDERTEVFSCEFKEAVKLINTLTKEIVPRTTMYKEFCAEHDLGFQGRRKCTGSAILYGRAYPAGIDPV